MGIYDKPDAPYLDDDLLDEGERLFDRAETVADNEEILSRVRTARLSIRFVRLSRMPGDEPDRERKIRAFFKEVKAAGITQIREWTPLALSEKEMLG